jgi:hypothetical protein
MEDFIPPGIAALAVQRYLETVCGTTPADSRKVIDTALISEWTQGTTLHDAIGRVVRREFGEDAHVDKVGFARAVVEIIQLHHAKAAFEISSDDLAAFQQNFRILLAKLAQLQRKAERDSMQERISQRIDRSIKAFLRDHPTSCRREDAMILMEEIDTVLDDSMEADEVRLHLQKLRRLHDLTEPKPGMVDDFAAFAHGLGNVRYSAVIAVQQEVVDLTTPPQPVLPAPDDAAIADESTKIAAGSESVQA